MFYDYVRVWIAQTGNSQYENRSPTRPYCSNHRTAVGVTIPKSNIQTAIISFNKLNASMDAEFDVFFVFLNE